MIKNTIFNNRNKHRNENNYNSSNQNEVKYLPMSEGTTSIVEPNQEVLPLL